MAGHNRNLRSGEVATALGLAPSTVQSYARRGKIPYRLTPGRQYRFNLDEVRAILMPPAVEVVADLPDVFATTAPLVDSLSGFRNVSPSSQAMRAARIRGVRDRGKRSSGNPIPAAGRDELVDLVGHSTGFAPVVLRRDDALV